MSSLLRQATNAARQASRTRAFASSAASRKDLVQDLYLREIKAYKPAPAAKDAHVGSVKQYSLPPAPKVPAIPTDLASEHAAYDAAEPTLAAPTAAPSESAAEETAGGAEEFLETLKKDLPPKEVHH
ncbi:ATP synthase complex subunit H-domain-containing protein [Cyathus striatus]|nr:ATP synthase complex subunit H-domain-containing protein [Cyathus striatus]